MLTDCTVSERILYFENEKEKNNNKTNNLSLTRQPKTYFYFQMINKFYDLNLYYIFIVCYKKGV